MRGLYDIHCHIIPGVDDGSSSFEESVRMLKLEYNEGVRTIIATPHFRRRMFETPIEEIVRQFIPVRDAAAHIGSQGIRMFLGCELHSTMDMETLIEQGAVATMAGTRYVLSEFSGAHDTAYVRERLSRLINKGFKPIIAHIERYPKVRKDLSFITDLVNMGCLVQVNAESIIGKEGLATRSFCNKLMAQDLLHFVASDCHNTTDRVPNLKGAYQTIAAKMGEDYADELLVVNPSRILRSIRPVS